ncbi:MAG: alanyl-tRNA editing protein [Oscillospiraceae bacterium]|nr:alanyl-tRNA editing protein [Oscillospiraceae bacterium]
MSEKLFYTDRYMTDFDGTVLSCTEDKKGWAIVLDQTAFYPEGGGQPCDRGVMCWGENTALINDVREKSGQVVHYSDTAIPEGTQVHGTIDWDRRFDMMQQHTGEHIFSGVVNSMFGYNNVGFHLSEKDNVVDFDGPMTKEDIKAVMDRCNAEIWANRPVIAGYPENVKELEYRSKKELSGPIRIVSAGNADTCACCGTHTSTTAQAGPVVAISSMAYKGGTRINILCGRRAVEYLKQRNDDCYAISHQLSAPVEKITDAVAARMAEIDQLKYRLAGARRQLMAVWAEKAEVTDGLCIMVSENLRSNEILQLTQMLAGKANTALVYSPQQDTNGKLCIISTEKDTNKLGRHISATLGGKGGGKPGTYQGFVEKETDADMLSALVKSFQ